MAAAFTHFVRIVVIVVEIVEGFVRVVEIVVEIVVDTPVKHLFTYLLRVVEIAGFGPALAMLPRLLAWSLTGVCLDC